MSDNSRQVFSHGIRSYRKIDFVGRGGIIASDYFKCRLPPGLQQNVFTNKYYFYKNTRLLEIKIHCPDWLARLILFIDKSA